MMMTLDTNEKDWRTSKKGKKNLRELRDYHLVGESFISELERSKSNNSRCHRCNGRIGKNTLRGIQCKLYDGGKGNTFNMRFVHCSECSLMIIKDRIKELRRLTKLIQTRKRTRKASYKKQKDLQLKDEILNGLLEPKDREFR